jgi:hypothetical protein
MRRYDDGDSSTWQRGALALVVGVVVLVPASAWAQASEAAGETTIPGGTLAVVSYMAFWVMLMGFAGYLGWRQKRLSGELETLEHRFDQLLERAEVEDAPEETSIQDTRDASQDA